MSEKKPETPAEWAVYSCQATCKIGRDALDDINPIPDRPSIEYAVYNLLHAVESLSKQVAELMKP